MGLATDLARLFRRDLTRLKQQIEAFPNDEMLWQRHAGIANSAGNLVLHLEGNLREYVDRQIGGRPYRRTRDLEFSSTGLRKQELLERISNLQDSVPSTVEGLSPEQLREEYPETVLEVRLSTQAFLVHLYGHLNWHLGQIDHLRRVLSGSGAIERAGL